MTAQNDGVSSASAGGAPAPTFDHESAQESVRRLAQLFGMSVADVAGPPFRPNCRCQVTPLPPFKRRPVLGDPSLNMTGNEDGVMWSEGVGWALSWGCQLTFGRDDETAAPYVQVSLSDEDRRRGITQRTATRAQVAEFARMLTEQFGEPAGPDPRDTEIERLRKEYDEVLVSGVLRETLDAEIERLRAQVDELAKIRVALFGEVRQALAERDDARKQLNELDQVRAEVERLTRDLRACEIMRNDAGSQRDRALRERDNVTRARDEWREEWERADAEVTRLKRLVGNENVSYDGWDQSSRHDAIVRCEEGWQEYLKARDERDRLRQELDLALKRNDELRSTQGLMGRALLSVRDTVREVDAELKANAEADRDIAQANERALRRRLNRIAQETNFESALDAEPENGHTVSCGAGNEDYSELSCTLTSGHGGEHQDRTQGATWPVEMAVDTKAGA